MLELDNGRLELDSGWLELDNVRLEHENGRLELDCVKFEPGIVNRRKTLRTEGPHLKSYPLKFSTFSYDSCLFIILTNISLSCEIFFANPFLFFVYFQTTIGRGFFELEILEFTNYRGELANGECCGAIHSEPCRMQCQTFFRVCLKEYQINVTSTGSCSFGNTSSPVLGGNSFTLADPENANGKLVLPFSFSWTVSFKSKN